MGAWIEINDVGLTEYCNPVAPFMGAWIEIVIRRRIHYRQIVAPFMGAWIEINLNNWKENSVGSLPSWERGLK